MLIFSAFPCLLSLHIYYIFLLLSVREHLYLSFVSFIAVGCGGTPKYRGSIRVSPQITAPVALGPTGAAPKLRPLFTGGTPPNAGFDLGCPLIKIQAKQGVLGNLPSQGGHNRLAKAGCVHMSSLEANVHGVCTFFLYKAL